MAEQEILWRFRWAMFLVSASILAFDMQLSLTRTAGVHHTSGGFLLPGLFLLGIISSGFVMGWTTVRKWRDVLFGMAPALTYPILAILVQKPGGDAGIGAGIALLIMPIVIVPIMFAGVMLGWRLAKK